MKLNRYVVLLITIIVDIILLGLGSYLIASANTGGSFVFVIECAIIFAAHKAVYSVLTGDNSEITENEDEESNKL